MNDKTKPPEISLKSWYRTNLKSVVMNNWLRIGFLFLDASAIVILFYLLASVLNATTDLGAQVILLSFFASLLCLPLLYAYRTITQIGLELDLNIKISTARAEARHLRFTETNVKIPKLIGRALGREIKPSPFIIKPYEKRDFRALQVNINDVRKGLKAFVEYSEVLTPPIYNYELNRLQKAIDIFFNSISEVFVETRDAFSKADKIRQQQLQEYYETPEFTREALNAEFESIQKAEKGEIDSFDARVLDELLQYLGDELFIRTNTFSPLSYKHPINLIMLSRFFDRWNSIVASCANCKDAFNKSTKDIEDYYKAQSEMESLRRQRMWRLRDDALIVIVSVIISTAVQLLIKYLSG